MSGITWRDCVVEAIGDAYLCYFPELDVREHLPLARLPPRRRLGTRRRTRRTTPRTSVPPFCGSAPDQSGLVSHDTSSGGNW